jgi:methionyl aminopeptidase
MIYYKTNEEVELMRKSNLLVCDCLAEMAKVLQPGITPKELDTLAYTFFNDHGGVPAFLNYPGQHGPFPATVCISLNEAVVHGIPTTVPIKEGDIVSLDTGVILNGYVGDSAYTFAVGEVSEDVQRLMRVTKQSLYKGIGQAIVGNRIGDIGYAVQDICETKNKFGVVRDLCGHGLGKKLHEEPEVPNTGRRGNGIKLQDGLVIAIEPMVNLGKMDVILADDDWTIITKDKKISAHYEHSICVRKGKADILGDFTKVEAAEEANNNLMSGFYN